MSGTGEAGSTIIVTDADGNTSTTVVDENGHWTFPENPLTEGEVGSIEAIDTNGNESGQAPVVGGDQHVDVPEITENGTSLSGTGEAGSTIIVTDVDGNTSTTVVDENGNWTFPENPLTEGEVGSIEAIDTNGNESGEVELIGGDQHVDVPEITENGTSLSGTGEAGSTIIVTDADGNTSTTVVDENGNWTFPENPLTEGEVGSIEAIDTNGNESGKAELVGGDQHVDVPEITENGTSLSGTGEAGSTIIVTDADGNTSTTVVDENGHWTFPENPLTEGEVGSIEAIDTNGNESGEVELIGGDQHVDIPEITENGTSLSGTGEVGSTVTVTDSKGNTYTTVVDENGNWNFPKNPLAEGDKGTIEATDKNDNESGKAGLIGGDQTPPVAPEAQLANDTGVIHTDGVSSDGTVNVNYLEDTATWFYSLDGGKNWTQGTGHQFVIPEGEYAAGQIQMRQTDEAGYSSEITSLGHIVIDSKAPAQPVVSINAENTLSGTAEAGAVVILTLADSSKVSTTVDADGKWSFGPNPLASGETGQLTVVDLAGNTSPIAPTGSWIAVSYASEAQIFGFYDNYGTEQGLNKTSGTVTDDRSPTLQGSINGELKAGSQVAIIDTTTGIIVGYATVDADTQTWTFEISGLVDQSSQKYQAVIENKDGTRGNVSDAFEIKVSLSLIVDSISTVDKTPIITGSIHGEIAVNEYLEVTVNGVTYSSKNGAVVLDTESGRWYLQIPENAALSVGKYDVQAILKGSAGNVAQDHTSNEVVITEPTSTASTLDLSSANTSDISTAVTLGEDGVWRILTNGTVFDQKAVSSSNIYDLSKTTLTDANGNTQYSSSFVDIDRDGLMDILGEDSNFVDGQQSYKYDGTKYTTFQIGATDDRNSNTHAAYGSVVIVDLDGNGYGDIVYGAYAPSYESYYNLGSGFINPDYSYLGSQFDTSIVFNTNGTIAGFDKTNLYVDNKDLYPTGASSTDVTSTSGNAQPDKEVAGVDLNNDGYVDIVYHGTTGSNNGTVTGTTSGVYSSTSPDRLVVLSNSVNASGQTVLKSTQVVTGVFKGLDDSSTTSSRITTMTWADLNGDGYMDLVMAGSGTASTSSNYAATRIFYNDGTGKLTAGENQVGIGSNVQTLTDTTNSNISLALDWNCDGKMDFVEFAGVSHNSTDYAADTTNQGLVWLNGGVNSSTKQVNWTSQNILKQANLSNTQYVTGVLSVDLDWNGVQDLIVFRAGGGASSYIQNTTKIQDGTSIILRILDQNGVNAYFGNTVALIDEATGQVVATQIINAQSGTVNNSTGLVYFYGLDASKTYSAVILANGKDYGGIINYKLGTDRTIVNYNETWGGLKAVAANHAYVLTTENGDKAASTAAATDATNTTGIVGTGYNDTLYATAGQHIYNGGGGSTIVSGETVWSSTGGMDIIDYKLAVTKSLNVDLSLTTAQNTGFGIATLINIEGVAGAGGNDVFTNNGKDNSFEGRGGNDTFNLIHHGGHDTLIYKVLDSTDGTGGNGADSVKGFTVGLYEANTDADRIDLKDLLVGYQADQDGAAHYQNGKATIDANDTIEQFLRVVYDGQNSYLQIDRNGTGGHYQDLLVIQDVKTDLATLLANHQIIIA
ncbi:hypothetical protein L289_0794 [Acinetobacter gerneri DSM 14967 = CIP 107464 = MTCC 9824]|nr:hypothetical protein L289_0794 [Acinetobacter gerneri DSM 14967 = CIP 107464 = MTCC 9824]